MLICNALGGKTPGGALDLLSQSPNLASKSACDSDTASDFWARSAHLATLIRPAVQGFPAGSPITLSLFLSGTAVAL
jgi:hypothetical protein